MMSSLYCNVIVCMVFSCIFQAVEQLDSSTLLIGRSYGMSLLSASLPWFLLHDTRDATVHITLMMSNVVVSFYPLFSLLVYTPRYTVWVKEKSLVVYGTAHFSEMAWNFNIKFCNNFQQWQSFRVFIMIT